MARRRPRSRWDCPGVMMIGDRVIWDGEGEYLGLEPLKTIPVAENLQHAAEALRHKQKPPTE